MSATVTVNTQDYLTSTLLVESENGKRGHRAYVHSQYFAHKAIPVADTFNTTSSQSTLHYFVDLTVDSW